MNKIERKIKKDSQKVYLLSSEREALAKSIIGDFEMAKERKPSPHYPYLNIFSTLSFRFSVALVLIIMIFGVPFTYASQNSIPGDLLYKFEINVLEEIEEKFYFSNESKSKFYLERLNERLQELEAVKDNPEANEIVESVIENIKEHSNSKLLALKDLENEKKEKREKKIRESGDSVAEINDLVEFLAVVEANKELIKVIKNGTDSKDMEEVTISISNELDENIEELKLSEDDPDFINELTKNNLEEINTFYNEISEGSIGSETFLQDQLQQINEEINQGDFVSALMISNRTRVEILKQSYLYEAEINNEESIEEIEVSIEGGQEQITGTDNSAYDF